MEWMKHGGCEKGFLVRPPLRGFVLCGAMAVVIVASVAPAFAIESPGPQPASDRWLAVVNYYRSTAYLPRVSEDPALTRGARKHAEYMVGNDYVGHTQDPKNPLFSVAGSEAGASANVAGWWGSEASDRDFVEMWMVGPFHALGILRPNLEKVGYGVARDAKGVTSAAALDVIRGLDYSEPTDETVIWPGHRSTQPLFSYVGGEYPDPLSSCRNYSAPAGLPVIVQFANPVRNPAFSFKKGSGESRESLPACEVDASNYRNPDAAAQSLGRALLAGDNVVLVIPKDPLEPGKSYVVKVTSGAETVRSRFSITP